MSTAPYVTLLLTFFESKSHFKHMTSASSSSSSSGSSRRSGSLQDGEDAKLPPSSLQYEAYQAFKVEKKAQQDLDEKRDQLAAQHLESVQKLEHEKLMQSCLEIQQKQQENLMHDAQTAERLKKAAERVEELRLEKLREQQRVTEEEEIIRREILERRASEIALLEEKNRFLHMSLEEKQIWLEEHHIDKTPVLEPEELISPQELEAQKLAKVNLEAIDKDLHIAEAVHEHETVLPPLPESPALPGSTVTKVSQEPEKSFRTKYCFAWCR